MPTVHFTRHLESQVSCPAVAVEGVTVRQAVDAALRQNPRVRHYVLDDQDRLRRHIMVFVDGAMLADRIGMSDPVGPEGEVYVMQALSGG